MSPLIDIQRRLAEVGRIRMGEKIGNRPAKRDTWRITSRDKARMEAVCVVYPGVLRPWDNSGSSEWELLTETDALNVMVLPGQTLSQWYEMWSGGGCQRRCDGATMNVPGDQPCMCPPDQDERAELASKGRACKATSRLSVMLPDVQGLGVWRLETHGYYAAVELAGVAELLERATASGVMLAARLRIDQRTSVKAGQTRRFPVPMLEVEATPHELKALGSSSAVESRPALPASPGGAAESHEAEEPGSLEITRGTDGLAQADVPISGATTPAPPAFISEADRRKVFARSRDKGLSTDALREILGRVTGQTSTAAIPSDKLDDVYAAIESA